MSEERRRFEREEAERIAALVAKVLGLVKEHYEQSQPPSRQHCYQALNALAVSTGWLILGCDGRGGEAHRFFAEVLERQLELAERLTSGDGAVPGGGRN